MLGLSTTQLLLLAAGAVYLFFARSPGGGWLKMIRRLLGGDTEDLLGSLITEFYRCGKCTPEEEAKVEEALSIIINHTIKHRLSPNLNDDARLRAIEQKLKELTDGRQVITG